MNEKCNQLVGSRIVRIHSVGELICGFVSLTADFGDTALVCEKIGTGLKRISFISYVSISYSSGLFASLYYPVFSRISS